MAVIKAETCCIKWRLVLNVDLRSSVCVLFCLIVWIHSVLCELLTNVTQYTSAQSFLFLSKATCFD